MTEKPEPADVTYVTLADGREYRVEPRSLHLLSPGLFTFALADTDGVAVAGNVKSIESFTIPPGKEQT
jgi:hypothetical protein